MVPDLNLKLKQNFRFLHLPFFGFSDECSKAFFSKVDFISRRRASCSLHETCKYRINIQYGYILNQNYRQ